MTPVGTTNELDVQNEWEENTHTHTNDDPPRSDGCFFLYILALQYVCDFLIRLLPQCVQHASAYPGSSVSHNKFHLLYSLLVPSRTNKSTKDNLKFHFTTQLNWQPTIVYFKLAQLSRRKGHNYANSQAHSQDGSQACRGLGWQKRGGNEIGEAPPSSSATKQTNFYPVLIV